MKQQDLDKISEILQKVFNEKQLKPNQYVIAYKRKDNDELIGYHYDSFCNYGSDILKAKRYNGEDPYPQLSIINKNLQITFESTSEYTVEWKKSFNGLTYKDLYVDAVYLSDGIEPQQFTIKQM